MATIQDTYFLNYDVALKEAQKQNMITESMMQICYYDGELREDGIKNLVNVPFDNMSSEFLIGNKRHPTKISLQGLDLSIAVQADIIKSFQELMISVNKNIDVLGEQLIQEIKNQIIDFNEPLRFLICANRDTQVMQNISKEIADTLLSLGYDVRFELNDELESMNIFRVVKSIYEYKPHVQIDINHIYGEYLNNDTFNFVWFQDGVPILMNNRAINLRKRDFLFHLTKGIENFILHKGITSSHQGFCINENIYKKREAIKKEKKIVFIGSSYSDRIKQLKDDSDFDTIYKDALSIFESKSCLKSTAHEDSEIQYLMDKYNKEIGYINNIYGYLMRDYCVEKLCSIDTDYEIEIYGHNWTDNKIVKPYYKGVLQYGEDISKVYNSATYGYCPGGYVLMQRTLECAFSNTIPLVLDARADKQDNYKMEIENGIQFFNINELEKVLSEDIDQTKNLDFIKKEYGYNNFIEKILTIINKEIDCNK